MTRAAARQGTHHRLQLVAFPVWHGRSVRGQWFLLRDRHCRFCIAVIASCRWRPCLAHTIPGNSRDRKAADDIGRPAAGKFKCTGVGRGAWMEGARSPRPFARDDGGRDRPHNTSSQAHGQWCWGEREARPRRPSPFEKTSAQSGAWSVCSHLAVRPFDLDHPRDHAVFVPTPPFIVACAAGEQEPTGDRGTPRAGECSCVYAPVFPLPTLAIALFFIG